MKKNWIKNVHLVNRILLGLVMLVPGIIKLFVIGPNGIIGMLSGLGFPIVGFFAWVLILSEIIFGIAILANYKLKYTVFPAIIILIVATFTVQLGNYSSMLTHLALVANYILIAYDKHKD